MPKLIDRTGMKFGKLTVLYRAGTDNSKKVLWHCKCECGNEIDVRACDLKHGTHSCLKCCHTTHGQTYSRLYKIWRSMKHRCKYNHHYIEKNVKICNEWKKFEPFRDWSLANGYQNDLTIDRINNYGNYEPSNCRWTTNYEQMRNTTYNRILTYDGITLCATDWAKKIGIHRGTIYSRLRKGLPIEKVLCEYNKRGSN